MWTKIEMGTGTPGKLWTGDNFESISGKFARVELVEFHSPASGASTRRLFVAEVREDAPEGIYVPTLRICAGGVGSLVTAGSVTRELRGEPIAPQRKDSWGEPIALGANKPCLLPLLVWNWSGRIGGYIILDPVMTERGYVRHNEVNSALPGYAWIHTYEGSTLSEYVLVRTYQADDDGCLVDPMHTLPIHRVVTSLLAPPEREIEIEEVSE